MKKKLILLVISMLVCHSTTSKKPEIVINKIETKLLTIRLSENYPNGWDWMLPKIEWKEYKTIKHYIK